MYYVYILKSSKSGILYYGFTTDLKNRFKEHNLGKSRFTKGHLPWELVFYSAFKDRKRAEDFELYIKSGSGKAFVYKRLVDVAFSERISGRKSAPKPQRRTPTRGAKWHLIYLNTMPKSDPNDFNKTTVDILAKRAGQVCSKCKRHTSGGNSAPTKVIIVGDAAHIEGAQSTSARYNSRMTSEERSDIKNGIWLCKTCHKEIDDDPIKYTMETLKKMKKDHEESILNLEPLNPSLGSINLEHNKVEIKEGDSYIINNIYMATPSPQIPDTIVTGGEEMVIQEQIRVMQKQKLIVKFDRCRRLGLDSPLKAAIFASILP